MAVGGAVLQNALAGSLCGRDGKVRSKWGAREACETATGRGFASHTPGPIPPPGHRPGAFGAPRIGVGRGDSVRGERGRATRARSNAASGENRAIGTGL